MTRPTTAEFRIKQSDTLPKLSINLIGSTGGADPIPPTAVVRFHMRRWGSTSLTVNSSTSITITSTSTGGVRQSFTAAMTATTGAYWAEVQVTTSSGVKTYPNSTRIHIEIVSQVG